MAFVFKVRSRMHKFPEVYVSEWRLGICCYSMGDVQLWIPAMGSFNRWKGNISEFYIKFLNNYLPYLSSPHLVWLGIVHMTSLPWFRGNCWLFHQVVYLLWFAKCATWCVNYISKFFCNNLFGTSWTISLEFEISMFRILFKFFKWLLLNVDFLWKIALVYLIMFYSNFEIWVNDVVYLKCVAL